MLSIGLIAHGCSFLDWQTCFFYINHLTKCNIYIFTKCNIDLKFATGLHWPRRLFAANDVQLSLCIFAMVWIRNLLDS